MITTQSEKHKKSAKIKVLHKKIVSNTTDLVGMKAVIEKLEKYNELLAEASKHQTKINETLRHENSEVLRVKENIKKIAELLCADKTSVTPNNKDPSQRCKYSKEIETAKDQLQSRIAILSINIEITRCQANEENLVLEGGIKLVVAERDRAVAAMENSFEEHNTNQCGIFVG